MSIVVTGASGHVGSNLIRTLLDQGHGPIRACVRNNLRSMEGLDVECIQADILDAKSLRRAFEGADSVFHLAAYISIASYERKRIFETNVDGTRHVVQAALDAGVKRLVYTSSIEALLYPSRGTRIDESGETQPALPVTTYGQSKAQAEVEIQAGIKQGLDAVIGMPTAVVGPWDFKPSHFGQMFLDFGQRKLPALVGGGFDLVDVRDLCDGLIRIWQKAPCGQRYLLSGGFLQTQEIGQILETCTGQKAPRMSVPFWLAHLGAVFTPLYYRLAKAKPRFTHMALRMLKDCRPVSCDKARKELGYNPRPPREGIEAAVSWFQENGMLDSNPELAKGTQIN